MDVALAEVATCVSRSPAANGASCSTAAPGEHQLPLGSTRLSWLTLAASLSAFRTSSTSTSDFWSVSTRCHNNNYNDGRRRRKKKTKKKKEAKKKKKKAKKKKKKAKTKRKVTSELVTI